jgi:hypothetical protein
MAMAASGAPSSTWRWRSTCDTLRLYSLSRQLLTSRKDYYDTLNRSQRGDLHVSDWVHWFARQCAAAYAAASGVIGQALEKRRYWELHEAGGINERQRKVLQRLLDDGDGGFEGGLNAEKYMKLTGASKAIATRDLSEMVARGRLWNAGVGKAVRYYVNMPGWSHGVRDACAASAQTVAAPTLGGSLLSGPAIRHLGHEADALLCYSTSAWATTRSAGPASSIQCSCGE